MMKWTKPSASTVDYFERIAPGPPIEARQMFGMPSRFLNGHMLVSVFGDSLMLHLSEADREECIAAGARPFAPHGRSAKEYVEIQIGHFEDQTLKEWIVRGMRYLGSLPPRIEKPKREEGAAKSVRASQVPKRMTTKPPKAEAVKVEPAKAKKAAGAKAKPVKAKKAAPVKAKTKPVGAKEAKKTKRTKPVKAKSAAKRPAKKAARAKKATPRRTVPAKKTAAKKSAAKKRR